MSGAEGVGWEWWVFRGGSWGCMHMSGCTQAGGLSCWHTAVHVLGWGGDMTKSALLLPAPFVQARAVRNHAAGDGHGPADAAAQVCRAICRRATCCLALAASVQLTELLMHFISVDRRNIISN